MRQFSEILAIEADVQHIEGAVCVEMRNVRYFATDSLVFISALCTDPILTVLCFGILVALLLLAGLVIFEAYRDIFHIIQNLLRDWHIQLYDTAS